MGTSNNIQLLGLLANEHSLVFSAIAEDGRKSVTEIQCQDDEFAEIEQIASTLPFGSSEQQTIWLRGLKQDTTHTFCLRLASEGSRSDHWINVSSSTFAGLDFIFNQFALDSELIPEMPSCIRITTVI